MYIIVVLPSLKERVSPPFSRGEGGDPILLRREGGGFPLRTEQTYMYIYIYIYIYILMCKYSSLKGRRTPPSPREKGGSPFVEGSPIP